MSSTTSVRERGAAAPIIRKSSSSPPHAHTLIWQSGVSWAKGKTERRRMRQRRERKKGRRQRRCLDMFTMSGNDLPSLSIDTRSRS